MSAPPPSQIREANAHSAAVHRRAAESERRSSAAERTIGAQAERSACHDQHSRAASDESGRAKDREISALQEQSSSSEATVRSSQAAVDQRDQMIQQLQPRADSSQDITRHRPPSAASLATSEEAEESGPLPASHSHRAQLLPDGPGPPSGNNMGKEEGQDDQDDQQPAVFGTTV